MPDKQKRPRTLALYDHAKQRIPGGTQLLSKRPELMAPDQWPAYYSRAKGCRIWDLDGNRYYDMATNGIGACLLGFADPDVSRAVTECVKHGSMSTLNPSEEVELADLLCRIHPWAECTRFARTGGEIAAVAVRIARATTDRSIIAVCGYSGWHDWYLAANLGEDDSLQGHLLSGLEPAGVPRELRGTTVTFHYNDRSEFDAIIDRFGDRLAAVVMEPARYHDPDLGFLEHVRNSVHRHGALLVYDEITIGWRLIHGGSHLKFGVNPDMAIFAKALGNGHPVAAVIGTKAAMEGAHKSFISSTYWTERVGPVAALATLSKLARSDVPSRIAATGARVMNTWKEKGNRHGLPVEVGNGYPCLAHFKFDHEKETVLRTLYAQYMLQKSFLASCTFYPTLAHDDKVLDRFDRAVDKAFRKISRALKKGNPEAVLDGPVAHTGFARLN